MTKASRRTFLKTAILTGAASVLAAEQTLAQTTVLAVPNQPVLRGRRRGGGGMSITTAKFGETADGKPIDIYTLDNGKGISVEVLSLGGIIRNFNVPDRTGRPGNISAILETAADYEKHRPFFGALVGRYGNRIANGKFTLDGVQYTLPTNNGPNSLHGGNKGFDTVVWEVSPFGENTAVRPNSIGLQLKYTSQDGEEGYPGKLDVMVIYRLDDRGKWTMDYTAWTDRPTVVNLTNHTFWNLAGFPNTNHNHILTLNADYFLPTDDTLIPTGELQHVAGTPFDFRTPRPIGERIHQVEGEHFAGGYDHCYALNQRRLRQMTHCADVYEPSSGRVMRIETTEPGVQFYAGNFLNGETKAFGVAYEKHGAFCLETQHFPDSPNKPQFPSTVLRPGEIYRTTTVHTFGVR